MAPPRTYRPHHESTCKGRTLKAGGETCMRPSCCAKMPKKERSALQSGDEDGRNVLLPVV